MGKTKFKLHFPIPFPGCSGAVVSRTDNLITFVAKPKDIMVCRKALRVVHVKDRKADRNSFRIPYHLDASV